MNEIFKPIKGYEGLYEVSNLGRVKSLKREVKDIRGSFRTIKERILKQNLTTTGYLKVGLNKNGKPELKKIHQLVSIEFLNHKPCGMKLVINHINLNKLDNRLENLEIITNRKNTNRQHIKSTSKYTGVHWHSKAKKWRSQITVNGNTKYLGVFESELEASMRYISYLKHLTPTTTTNNKINN